MDSQNDTDEKEWTPSGIFRHIFGMFVLQGLIRGIAYGLVYGMIYGTCIGFIFGLPTGLLYGILIGAIVGTIMGVIGGCVLGGFSVSWGRRQGGIMTEQHTANRDGYRRGVRWLAVTTAVLGCLFLFPLIVRVVYPTLWDTGPLFIIFLDLVPSLIAGFAAYQAGQMIIAWYETNVGVPRNIMFVGSAQKGVWPPPPIRPVEPSAGIGERLKE